MNGAASISAILGGPETDTTHVVLIAVLVIALAYTGYYAKGRGWWREPVGWVLLVDGIVWTAFLAIMSAQIWFPVSTVQEFRDITWAEVGLLVLAGTGMAAALVLMWRFRHRH